jgi:hypothetical protein
MQNSSQLFSRMHRRAVSYFTKDDLSSLAVDCQHGTILYNYSLLLRSIRVFMDLRNQYSPQPRLAEVNIDF